MTRGDIEVLSTYNGEKARGLVHTPEWVVRMADLQHEFNERQRFQMVAVAHAIGAELEEAPGGGFFITPIPLQCRRWCPRRGGQS